MNHILEVLKNEYLAHI